MQLLAAMAPPGGGRNHFSQRVSACFSTINVTAPNDAQLKRIFGTILTAKLSDFDDEVSEGLPLEPHLACLGLAALRRPPWRCPELPKSRHAPGAAGCGG